MHNIWNTQKLFMCKLTWPSITNVPTNLDLSKPEMSTTAKWLNSTNKIYKTTYPINIYSYSHDIVFLLPEYFYNQEGSE